MKTLYYVRSMYTSPEETLDNLDESGYKETLESAQALAIEHCKFPKQGMTTFSKIYKITIPDNLNIDDIDLYDLEQKQGVEIDFDFMTIEPEYESIEDRLIVSYCHRTYMNYSHELMGLRFGKKGETTENLSDNTDQTNIRWDYLTELTKYDFENMREDEFYNEVANEISFLKYGGYNKTTLGQVIEDLRNEY
jgi:hypothetical protein